MSPGAAQLYDRSLTLAAAERRRQEADARGMKSGFGLADRQREADMRAEAANRSAAHGVMRWD